MSKITIIGAGGVVFPLRMCIDMLAFPALRESTICLFDPDAGRLARTAKRVQALIDDNKLKTRVIQTTDRKAALRGATYVIVTFQVGGLEAYQCDVDIPARYGLDQPVGDTLGPGGVFRGLRSLAALMPIVRDMQAVCPDALMLQYANPMAINCWATSQLGIKTVGLCHSVQGTSRMLITRAGFAYDDISFQCAGINHQAWFIAFRDAQGRDVSPVIHETMLRENPTPLVMADGGQKAVIYRGAQDEHYYYERVRTEILRTFGYFHTESSHHGSEYTPWFRKDARTVRAYIPKRWGYVKETIAQRLIDRQDQLDALAHAPLALSEEYGARIIHACETGQREVIHGNVPNDGMPGHKGGLLIGNLPANACVEVACVVDRNGVQPLAYGHLPPQCAAINRTNINVQELAVIAGLTGNRDAVHHAIAMDPLTGALMTLPKIRAMVDEMLAAEARWLPQFKG